MPVLELSTLTLQVDAVLTPAGMPDAPGMEAMMKKTDAGRL